MPVTDVPQKNSKRAQEDAKVSAQERLASTSGEFPRRHIGPGPDETKEMLGLLGFSSLDVRWKSCPARKRLDLDGMQSLAGGNVLLFLLSDLCLEAVAPPLELAIADFVEDVELRIIIGLRLGQISPIRRRALVSKVLDSTLFVFDSFAVHAMLGFLRRQGFLDLSILLNVGIQPGALGF